MFRLFDMLGKSTAMRVLDDAFRAVGLHPLQIPEPVKLTVIQLTKRQVDERSRDAMLAHSAKLMGYCMLGAEHFTETNSAEEAARQDARLEDALEAGDTFDAKLVLLALHADLIAPDIADRIDMDDLP